MSLNLKVGAFVVTDAHYSHIRPQFLDFLKDIDSKKLNPTQLILLGDMFDALFGGVKKTYQQNKEAVDILNNISKKIEVIYLEGNHDFNLKTYFPNIKVFPISEQPVEFDFNGKKVLFAHGDIKSPFLYRLYVSIIRNRFTLYFLDKLNRLFKNMILDRLDDYLVKKDDCNDFENFRAFIERRLGETYICDYLIEGHFHQNKTIDFEDFRYINIGAFACNQRYFSVESLQNLELTQEKYS